MSKKRKTVFVSDVLGSASDRGVFQTARARAVLAAELPDVIYNPRASSRPRLSVGSVVSAVVSAVSVPKPAPPPPVYRGGSAHLEMRSQALDARRDAMAGCKPRPADSRRKGVDGSSRAFIPWCRRAR